MVAESGPLAAIDVIYPVRDGLNDELRFSLRSLANVPHGRVWIVGDKPDWVTNVEFIPGNRIGWKWLNVPDNLRLACAAPGMGEQMLMMNDDFFITEPVTDIPTYYRGLLTEQMGRNVGVWRASLRETNRVLGERGIEQPLSYELHMPIVMRRDWLAEVLAWPEFYNRPPPQWRTAYGNYWHVPATKCADVRKGRHEDPPKGPFASTDDHSFYDGRIGKWLRERFRVPSPYEKD